MKALRFAIKEYDADIIHCHGSQDTWITASTLALGKVKTRLVRTKHNSYQTKRHSANKWLYNKAISHTIAVAAPIRDELISDGFVNQNKVSVIHAGLEDSFATAPRTPREEIRKEWGISATDPVIGLVGRLAPDKGQDTLLKSAKEILKEIPDAKIVLVGTGGDWDRIKAMISELNLENVVTWAGFRKDVGSVTAAFDVALLAARACDASSTVLKEAMVLGVPVVATDVGGTCEIVDNGRCGILVAPGDEKALSDGIIATLKNKEDTIKRIEAAKIHVQQYLASNIAQMTENIYKNVIADGRKNNA
jgi:glycosyltransferase involved in cell wall biosynthesis